MTHQLIEQITGLIGPETDENEMGYNHGLRDAADLVAAWLAANTAQSGWVIANGANNRWRCVWEWESNSEWTDNIAQALKFATRDDAEKFSKDDEDAWLVYQVDVTPARIMAALSSTPVATSEPAETAVKTGKEVMPNDPRTTRPEDDTSPGVTAGAITPTLDALAMQRAAAKIAENFSTSEHIAHSIRTGNFPEQTDIRDAISDAIAAIPLPPGAALAEALRLPEIAAVVEALEACVDEDGQLYVSQSCGCRNCGRVVAALAALREQP